MRFKDKVVLVTGGNGGIGFAVAKRIAEEGGKVLITGRDRNKLDDAIERIGPAVQRITADWQARRDRVRRRLSAVA